METDNRNRSSIRVVILDDSSPPGLIEEILDLLEEQWPHEKSLRGNRSESIRNGTKDKLPIHIALVCQHEGEDTREAVISYAKLQGAYGKDYGHSAVAYSVVVKKELRGNGYGRRTMSELETVAKGLGLSYLYLFTDDKVDFYKHLGYLACEPISTLGQNARRLKPSQVEALEGIFAKRLNLEEARCNSQTWLRKRLFKLAKMNPPCEWTTVCSTAMQEVKCWRSLTSGNDSSHVQRLTVVYMEVSHEQQVGPMCGITALNMAAHCISKTNIRPTSNNVAETTALCNCCGEINASSQKSTVDNILDFAIGLGITGDGEVFCAYNLASLCAMWYHIPAEVVEINDQETFLKQLLTSFRNGFPVLMAYDRDLGGFQPTQRGGKSAHWAVICGIVFDGGDTVSDLKIGNIYSDNNLKMLAVTNANAVNFRETVDLALLLASEHKEHDYFLVCVHGMSRLPFVCHVSTMLASNANLLQCGNKFFKAPSELSHLTRKVVFMSANEYVM